MAKSAHYRALDSFRAIGCILIAFSHWPSSGLLSLPSTPPVGTLVDCFFVLSGFVIGANYVERVIDGPSALRFGWLRIARLYPLHVATLFAMAALELIKLGANFAAGGAAGDAFLGTRAPGAILTNLGLVQIFGPYGEGTWNGPSWSISAEMWTYFIFAGLTALSVRARYQLYALAIIVSLAVLYLFAPHGIDDTAQFSVFRASVGFFAGIFVWRALNAFKGLAVRTPKIVWTLAEAILLAAPVAYTFFGGGHRTFLFTTPIVLSAFVFVFAHERGRISQILQMPWLVSLGGLSFSVYLIHRPLIDVVLGVCSFIQSASGLPVLHVDGHGALRLGPTGLLGDLMFIPYIAAVFAVSYVSLRYFEGPCGAMLAKVRVGRFRKPRGQLAANDTGRAPAPAGALKQLPKKASNS